MVCRLCWHWTAPPYQERPVPHSQGWNLKRFAESNVSMYEVLIFKGSVSIIFHHFPPFSTIFHPVPSCIHVYTVRICKIGSDPWRPMDLWWPMELRFRAFWSVTLDLSSLPQAELCRVSSQVFTVTVTVTAGLNFSRIWSQVLRPSVQSMRWRRRYGRCQMSSLIDTETSPPLVGLLNVSSQNVAISGKVWSPGFNRLWYPLVLRLQMLQSTTIHNQTIDERSSKLRRAWKPCSFNFAPRRYRCETQFSDRREQCWTAAKPSSFSLRKQIEQQTKDD